MKSNGLISSTVLELLQKEEARGTLRFGDPIFDQFLSRGLLPAAGLYEISGEAGTGKSQLAYQLLCQVQLPEQLGGLSGCGVLISTEGHLPKRFDDIADSYREILSMPYKEKTFFRSILNEDDQRKVIMELIPKLIEQRATLVSKPGSPGPVRLVVIDSIAALLRLNTQYITRAVEMAKISEQLRKLAFQYGLVMLCVNQVSDAFETDPEYLSSWSGTALSMGRRVKPALGLAWSNSVNHRYILTKHPKVSDPQVAGERRIHCIFSSYQSSEEGFCRFEIGPRGLRGIDVCPKQIF